jgi:hypothetical protein
VVDNIKRKAGQDVAKGAGSKAAVGKEVRYFNFLHLITQRFCCDNNVLYTHDSCGPAAITKPFPCLAQVVLTR